MEFKFKIQSRFSMKKLILFLFLVGLYQLPMSIAQSGDDVANMFQIKCGICHTIGGGKIIGPDLANVQDRHSEEWLISFIRSSQTMINNGDPTAVALYEEYNKVLMPDPMISDTEIKSLLTYIAENSAGGVGTAEQVSIIDDATPEDFERGEMLFQGRERLANGGPSCIACHNQLSGVFFAENSYSRKDLSQSFATLGETGVKVILESPPFPVMAKAFEKHKLKADEVHDLLVFLRGPHQAKSTVASGYILYGILGACILMLLFAGFWYERRGRSVNHGIFKRQIRSYN